MKRFKNIFVAAGRDERGRRAQHRAAMLSVELQAATLEMMTFNSDNKMLGTPNEDDTGTNAGAPAPQWPAQSFSANAPTVDKPNLIRSIGFGTPALAVVARAEEMEADLIVLPSHGENFLQNLIIRRRNEVLLRATNRSVLLVQTEPRSGYRQILVAVDMSKESKEAARNALLLAPNAHVAFVHAYQVPNEEIMRDFSVPNEKIKFYRERVECMARLRLKQFVDDLGLQRQCSRTIHRGDPVETISNFALHLGADLIAMGRHDQSEISQLLLGSVMQRVISKVPCDLLLAGSHHADQ
ncbi:MAG: universal stress protein [Telluria sp.]